MPKRGRSPWSMTMRRPNRSRCACPARPAAPRWRWRCRVSSAGQRDAARCRGRPTVGRALTGGAADHRRVADQVDLDLERRAFMALLQQPATLARIEQCSKPANPCATEEHQRCPAIRPPTRYALRPAMNCRAATPCAAARLRGPDARPIDAVLEEAAQVLRGSVVPVNRQGDEEGCRFENGVVRTPDGLQRGLPSFLRGRLDRAGLRSGLWRAGPAQHTRRRRSRR